MSKGVTLIILGILFALGRGGYKLIVHYEYQREIFNNWTLADRASTISQKSEYINKFVETLKTQNLEGVNNALFFPTPASSFDENFKALLSLRNRLDTISTMKENSFEYQTAIQQITQQEQGEAEPMLNQIEGCWYKKHHYTLWNPFITFPFFLIQVVMIVFGFIKAADD